MKPSSIPSTQPSSQPSGRPSTSPSSIPSKFPTKEPSIQPTGQPSAQPSDPPSSSSSPTCVNNFNICYSLDMSGSVCTTNPPAELCDFCSPTDNCGDPLLEDTETCCTNFQVSSYTNLNSQFFSNTTFLTLISSLLSLS